MGNRKVIVNYYSDVKKLADMLQKSVEANRFLIGAANEVNGLSMANISDVRDALKRGHTSGEIVEQLLEALEKSSPEYLNYAKIKSDVIENNIGPEYIQTEINTALKISESGPE